MQHAPWESAFASFTVLALNAVFDPAPSSPWPDLTLGSPFVCLHRSLEFTTWLYSLRTESVGQEPRNEPDVWVNLPGWLGEGHFMITGLNGAAVLQSIKLFFYENAPGCQISATFYLLCWILNRIERVPGHGRACYENESKHQATANALFFAVGHTIFYFNALGEHAWTLSNVVLLLIGLVLSGAIRFWNSFWRYPPGNGTRDHTELAAFVPLTLHLFFSVSGWLAALSPMARIYRDRHGESDWICQVGLLLFDLGLLSFVASSRAGQTTRVMTLFAVFNYAIAAYYFGVVWNLYGTMVDTWAWRPEWTYCLG